MIRRLFKLLWFFLKQIDVILMSFGTVLIFANLVRPYWDYVQYLPEILRQKDVVDLNDVGFLLQVGIVVLVFSVAKLFSGFNIKFTRVEKRYEETGQMNTKRLSIRKPEETEAKN